MLHVMHLISIIPRPQYFVREAVAESEATCSFLDDKIMGESLSFSTPIDMLLKLLLYEEARSEEGIYIR